MKKSRVIALLTAVAMIMSVIPAFASANTVTGGYLVDDDGNVYEKSGENMIENPSFEDGLTGLTQNDEYYEVVTYETSHSGPRSLKAIKSTKGDGAITAYFPVDDANASYYLSFWYTNTSNEVARRPRVTFAFTDASKTVPTQEDEFTEATHAWIQAGTASNDCDMEYSRNGKWVQYSTMLNGNGNVDACKYVVLNIYGLTKDVSFLDDFELYKLTSSEEYSDKFGRAVENWKNIKMPEGSLKGNGKINLVTDTGVEGVSVGWDTSHTNIFNYKTGAYSAPAKETLIIISAILYIEGTDIRYVFDYPYIVKSMFEPYKEWINNEVFGKIGSAISGDVDLPKAHSIEGYKDAVITWSCSDGNVLDGDGKFFAPEITKNVDITATITCENASDTVVKRVKALGGNIVGEGLIMYYDFETPVTKSEIKDNSKSANVYNATVEGVTLVDGYAKFAGGSSTIKLPANYATELTGSYSVSMWVNVDKNIASSSGMYRFFDFGGGTYTSQFLRYIPASGELSFMDRGTAENGNDWAIKTTATGFGQTWKLVTLTYDFTTSPALAKVYVDGQELASSADYKKLTNSVYNVATASSTTGYIGRTQWNNGENPDFIGLMDEVRVYNRAISGDEVKTLYEETRPTVTAPVTIKYVNIKGETLKEDVTVTADANTTYDVPASMKSLPATSDENFRYVYKYLTSQSTDSIYVSADGENICTLVFEHVKTPKGQNLIENPSFEDGVEGWTSNNDGVQSTITGWVRTTEVAHDGQYSLKRNSDVGSANADNFGTYIPIESGKKYKFSFWEYCDSDVGAGSTMMSAVCITANKSATNNSSNHLLQYGGYSSWVNDTNGIKPRDVAYASGWNQRSFEFDTTDATNANYIFVAFAWKAGAVFCVDDFVLEEVSGTSVDDPEDGEKIPVVVRFVDADGNKIKEDYKTTVKEGTVSYTVPASVKNMEDVVDGNVIYKYALNEELTAGRDTVSISILQDNICTLVYDVIKADKNSNLVKDGGFKDEAGNFSWGTWQSPETGNYFSNRCDDWFYVVNRETNDSVLYGGNLAADDYVLGTRWNDGTTGLCSLANFIPVEKGKTYIVSYDYKHQTAGVDSSYISTSFQTTTNFAAGAMGSNNPKNVSTDWQTNTFTITAPTDGYIYFHFSWVGSGGANGGNSGNGPYWYFDNFEVLEVITFENEITYANGQASVLAEDGTTGYLIQAMYNEEGALENVVISDKLTFSKEIPVKVDVQKGAKIMVVKDLTSLEPIAPAIIAE